MPPLIALTLLTVIPAPIRRAPRPREMGAAVAWYTAVGWLLGGLLVALDSGLRRTALTAPVVAVLLVAALALLTGFLHLDGVIDMCDAAFAHRTPTERLVIARDPRAGAFGVVGVVLVLLLKGALLAAPLGGHRAATLLCFPALARLAMAGAIVLLPTARGTAGMGGGVKEHAGWWTLLAAAIIGVIPAVVLLRWDAGVLVAGALIGGACPALLALRRLGGTTGDVYGAVCECAEIGALMGAALLAS